ncbi:MAG: hypothetical protein R2711_14085 [Acidimicrobiales bacterium]
MRAQQEVVLRTARQALADQGISVGQLTELSASWAPATSASTRTSRIASGARPRRCGPRSPPTSPTSRPPRPTGPWSTWAAAGASGSGCWPRPGSRPTGSTPTRSWSSGAGRSASTCAGDALAHLRELEPGTVRAVTSFHVVEHLSLDTLVGLLDAALVALAPGGALLLETPNPTNLNVGAASFYLDPTHLKPLHPQFLEFLVAQRGFATVEARYLNPEGGAELEVDDLAPLAGRDRARQVVDRINWALGGPLDVGIVARKAASA